MLTVQDGVPAPPRFEVAQATQHGGKKMKTTAETSKSKVPMESSKSKATTESSSNSEFSSSSTSSSSEADVDFEKNVDGGGEGIEI